MKKYQFSDHAESLLPENGNWRLVWHDEFDGTELDRSKWGFRRSFWGNPFPAFTEEGVELDGMSHLKLNLVRKNDEFSSPHLQTGSLTYDIPKDGDGFWPFGKFEPAKFMHKYGYYEIRCRMPKFDGWHAAFWLQAPGIGSHPDARQCGVECDIMENYRQFKDGKIIGGNLWGGYGKNGTGSGHFSWDFVETADRWHYYGVDWSPDGYRFYADGRMIGAVVPPEKAYLANRIIEKEGAPWLREGSVTVGPVSDVEQFILISTECHGYRENGKPDPLLFDAVQPDFFEVDFVRVYDNIH